MCMLKCGNQNVSMEERKKEESVGTKCYVKDFIFHFHFYNYTISIIQDLFPFPPIQINANLV